MKKIFAWKNKRTESDFDFPEENLRADHSASLVIIADDIEVAKSIAKKRYEIETIPVEIDSNLGIVVYSSGDC